MRVGMPFRAVELTTPTVFAAYIRALRWNTATAADRDLFQAPFRAGIRLDAYQLLPFARRFGCRG